MDIATLLLLLAVLIILCQIGLLIYQIRRQPVIRREEAPSSIPPETALPPSPPTVQKSPVLQPATELTAIYLPPPRIQPELRVASSEPPKYQKKSSLFSIHERRFYDALLKDLGDEFRIFAKVRLVDIIWLTNEPKDKWRHLNRVLSSHIDFVLCDVRHHTPLVGIELDDSTHARFDRGESDKFKESLFAHVQMPLKRFSVKETYLPGEIGQSIRDAIRSGPNRPKS